MLQDTKKKFDISQSSLMGYLGLSHIARLSNKFSRDKLCSKNYWTAVRLHC